jgi:O-acetyl-ADP-ribose deacetylase (regulator of RNase III)
MIEIKKGNIFSTNCQTIVNTINCEGVMGAGIALEFRLRYPEMFRKYQYLCESGKIDIGTLWIYKTANKNILNFPTKRGWRYPTKIEYIELGLKKFLQTYKEKNITSIAFPLLGAGKGGIEVQKTLDIMQKYLSKTDIPIEIWFFDPTVSDEFYTKFRKKTLTLSDNEIKELKIRKNIFNKLKELLNKEDINMVSGLLSQRGIGINSIEKLLEIEKNNNSFPIQQKTLF